MKYKAGQVWTNTTSGFTLTVNYIWEPILNKQQSVINGVDHLELDIFETWKNMIRIEKELNERTDADIGRST